MSNRVVDTPEIEAKKIFLNITEGEEFLISYVFESNKVPPVKYKTKEDYMRDLNKEYLKLKREEAIRLLGLK